MRIEPRQYQIDCVNAIFNYFSENNGHPIVCIPGGGGKSLIQAMIAERILNEYSNCRIIFLTHRRELIQQNFQEMIKNIGIVDAGIYSAGLHSRDTHNQILFAGIQSVYKRAKELGYRNLIVIDECHLLDNNNNSMYRKFLNDMFEIFPSCKIIGLSATPYRLNGGRTKLLTEGKYALFTEIIYNISLKTLMDKKYLCPLIGKTGIVKPDTSHVHKRGGEFIESELELVCDDMAIIRKAVSEIKELTQDRKHLLLFCVGIKHAIHVCDEMNRQGLQCEVVHSSLPDNERIRILEDYQSGKLKAIANVNILTVGYNAKFIDCIAILRPTESTSLYAQMCYRGTRLYPGKENCLILDYAGVILKHGYLDKIDIQTTGYDGETGVKTASMKECPGCKEAVLSTLAICPHCGYEWPVNIADMEVKHDSEAAALSPLSQYKPPIEYDVESVFYYLHEKNEMFSMRVSYGIGSLNSVSEWVCVEHEGFARQKAVEWLKDHLPDGYPMPDTVEECLDLKNEFKKPVKIFVDYNQKFPRIISRLYE